MSHRALWWGLTAGGVAAWLLLGAWTPAASDPVVCLFRRTLELPCPGCGLTRAFSHLARGDLYAAVKLHPAAPLLLAEALAAWGLLGLLAQSRAASWRGVLGRWSGRCLLGTAVALLALWLGRLAVGDLSAMG